MSVENKVVAKWFTVCTIPGREKATAENLMKNKRLEDVVLATKVPLKKEIEERTKTKIVIKRDEDGYDMPVEETEIIRREKEIVAYPNYVFAKIALVEEMVKDNETGDNVSTGEYVIDGNDLHAITETTGVKIILGYKEDDRKNNRAKPLTDEEVKDLNLEDEVEVAETVADTAATVAYEVGTSVKLIDGPLKGNTGVVKSVDVENNIIVVEISFLGRKTDTPVEMHQVQEIG